MRSPVTDTAPLRPVTPARVVLGLVLGGTLAALGAVVVLFLGLASPQLGWISSTAVMATCLLAGTLVAFGPRRRRTYAVAVTGGLLLGLSLWSTAPPDHSRIRAMVEDQDLTGFTEIGATSMGNTWCLKGCPVLELDYQADDPALGPVEAGTRLVEQLEADGWDEVARYDRGADEVVTLARGRWRAQVSPSLSHAEYGIGDPRTDVEVAWSAGP